MIIWGWRSVTSTASRGEFYCPQCQGYMAYAEKSVRRFFTLYFIPLIPLNSLGEYIECESCKETSALTPPRIEGRTRESLRNR